MHCELCTLNLRNNYDCLVHFIAFILSCVTLDVPKRTQVGEKSSSTSQVEHCDIRMWDRLLGLC